MNIEYISIMVAKYIIDYKNAEFVKTTTTVLVIK